MHLFLLSFVCIYVLQSIHSSPLLSIRWLALPFSPKCIHCSSAFLFVRWLVFWFTVLSFHIFDFSSSYSSICWRQFCRSSIQAFLHLRFHTLALPFLDSFLHSISHSSLDFTIIHALFHSFLYWYSRFFHFASNVSNRSFYFTQTIFFRWVFGASREYLGVKCCLEKYTLPWALWILALSRWLGISYLLSHNWVTTEWL